MGVCRPASLAGRAGARARGGSAGGAAAAALPAGAGAGGAARTARTRAGVGVAADLIGRRPLVRVRVDVHDFWGTRSRYRFSYILKGTCVPFQRHQNGKYTHREIDPPQVRKQHTVERIQCTVHV
jgi:hypothetical protein